MNIKKSSLLLVITLTLFSMSACSKNNKDIETSQNFNPDTPFDELVEQAKGDKVSFYGWGGDEDRNKWLSQTVAPIIKDKYDINLEIIPMDIDDILSKLSGEKQAGLENGSIDMIWINGENFYSAKENDLLFGPFTQALPNFDKYIDKEDSEIRNDFGFSIDGYEAPYSKAQLVFINDKAKSIETPANAEEFMDYCKKYKGKVTYPASTDFTGSAFIRTMIYDIVGHEQFANMKADKAIVKSEIEPALKYFRELNKYLWNDGKTFPATSGEVDNMFRDGELMMTLNYYPYTAAVGIEKAYYPDSVQTFLFDKGTVGNTNYIAIAKNSAKKAAAMIAINEIISAEIQATQFEELRSLPVISHDKLNDREKYRFSQIDIGKGVLPQDEILSKRLAEMPANIVPIIEELWLEEVVGK